MSLLKNATALLFAVGSATAAVAAQLPPFLPGPALRPGATPALPGDFIRLLPPPTSACTGLVGLSLPLGHVASAVIVDTGTIDPSKPALSGLPTFCRVFGEASTERGSFIKFEVWIPFDGRYRKRYLQVGNGGFSGAVPLEALAEGIRRGYAAAGTDDGNQVPQSPAFARYLPKLKDYGYRAIKVTTDDAKAIIEAAMGAKPSRSYFHGCSNGGRQALMEAQRYPDDFDGVAAGAPANFFTHQFISFAWNAKQLFEPAPSLATKLAASRISILSNAVRTQCAGRDGGLAGDAFLTNPPACHVNLAPITCPSGGSTAGCLTESELDVVRGVYAGPHDASAGQIFPGLEPGAEDHPLNWPAWITGTPAMPMSFQTYYGLGFFSAFVHGVPAYDLRNVTYTAAAVADIDAHFGDTLNSTNPDLSAFYDHGGKLIQYHGFDDSAVAPRNSINYWASVEVRMRAVKPGFGRAELDGFYRLFMVPGMAHCWLGNGATAFGNAERGSAMNATHDVMLALERWVEHGVAPDRIVAKSSVFLGAPGFERPICPWPQLPHYNGTGPTDAASSWSCVAPLYRLKPDVLPQLVPKIPVRPGDPVERIH